jgi:peptidoglycan/LPS O-acetylase OafA/YrhL
LSRIFWALAISWIIFACHHNYGGLIGWFLSLPVWQPIAALSYSIYIVHFVVQTLLAGTERQSVYLSDLTMTHRFLGDLGFSMIVAFVWTLSFEMPFPILENYFYGKRNDDKNVQNVGEKIHENKFSDFSCK